MSTKATETPMMRQFYAIKQGYPETILFFRMGDFYEMFGEDAIIAAGILQIALTSRNKNTQDSVPMCGIPFRSYERYLNKLTSAGYKVAICDQMEDSTQTQGLVKREIVRVVTPGTNISAQLIAPDENHYLLSLCIDRKQQQLGAAFADMSTGEFEVVEFSLQQMSRCYDFIAQLHPREILIPDAKSEQEKQFWQQFDTQLQVLINQENSTTTIHCHPINAYWFDPVSAQQKLTQHFQTLNLAGFGIEELALGIAASGALLNYLEDTQKCNLQHITSIRRHSFEQLMLLDENTLANLEIFDNQSGQRKHTLFYVLNHTCTPMGARLFRQWLRQPLLDIDAINQRFDSIDEFRNDFIFCEELRQRLKTIQDLPRIVGRISLPVVGIADLIALRESLIPIQTIPPFLPRFSTFLLVSIASQFDSVQDVLELLQRFLLKEPSHRLHEGGYIASGISEELDELRTLAKDAKTILNNLLLQEKEATGIHSLKN